MTVTVIDGFDLYNALGANTGLLAKWAQFNNAGATHSLVAGRFSGQAVRSVRNTGSTGGSIQRVLPGNYASFTFGGAMRWAALSGTVATYPDIAFYDSTPTIQCGFKVNGTGAIEAYRYTAENAGTLLGTSAAGVIAANTWHYVEVECTINDTTGVFKVYVDNTLVLNLTAQDTKNTANAFATALRLGSAINSGFASWTVDLDDMYVTDSAAKLGERRVETVRPSADTAQKDFTPNSGANNYSRVSDATADGDTTYVQASTVGNTDRYTHAGLSSTPATIDAVQVTAFAEKTDATSRSIALQVKSGATTSDGANFALAASYGKFDRIIALDPDTAAAWTASGVNNLEFGPKVTV